MQGRPNNRLVPSRRTYREATFVRVCETQRVYVVGPKVEKFCYKAGRLIQDRVLPCRVAGSLIDRVALLSTFMKSGGFSESFRLQRLHMISGLRLSGTAHTPLIDYNHLSSSLYPSEQMRERIVPSPHAEVKIAQPVDAGSSNGGMSNVGARPFRSCNPFPSIYGS